MPGSRRVAGPLISATYGHIRLNAPAPQHWEAAADPQASQHKMLCDQVAGEERLAPLVGAAPHLAAYVVNRIAHARSAGDTEPEPVALLEVCAERGAPGEAAAERRDR